MIFGNIADQCLELFLGIQLFLFLSEELFFLFTNIFKSFSLFFQGFKFCCQGVFCILSSFCACFTGFFLSGGYQKIFLKLGQMIKFGEDQVNGCDLLTQQFLSGHIGLFGFQCFLPGLKQKGGGFGFCPFFGQILLDFAIAFALGQQSNNSFQCRFCILQLDFQGILVAAVLLQKLRKQDQNLFHRQVSVMSLQHVFGMVGAFGAEDALHILADAVAHIFPLVFYRIGLLGQTVLELHIQIGMENAAENLLPFLGICQKKLQEIALSDHGNLGKLLPVKSQDFFHGRVDLPELGHDAAVGIYQFGIGGLFGHVVALAFGFGTHIFRITGDGVFFAGIAEAQLYFSWGGGVGIFGTEHSRLPVPATGFSEERKADGIENRCFASTGITGDQVQASCTEGFKVQFHPAGIRTECGHSQFQWSHWLPSQMDSMRSCR